MGRPVRLVSGRAMLGGGPYPVEPRFAWLFQVNRIAHHPDLSRKDFAALLQESGFPADEWKLTRWESGDHKIGTAAGVALDRLFGTDGPLITAALAYLKTSPMRLGRAAKEKPLVDLSSAAFDAAFERLLSGSGSGSDWYNVLVDPRIRSSSYLPSSVWKSLSAQLCSELSRAVGPAHALRKRAVSLLIGQGNGHVLAAFNQFVREARCQALASATLHLVYGRGPGYNELAIDTLDHEDSGGRWGAMHAVAAKLALGHFRSTQIPAIESHMLSTIDRGPLDDAGEALLRALPVDSQLRIAQSVRNGGLLLRSLRTLQPLASAWRQLTRSIAHQARDALGVEALQEDSMLEALVTEALLHPHYEGRSSARITLMASPYRQALGSAAIELLPGLATEQRTCLGEFLVFMVDSTHRDALAELALREPSPVVRQFAFLALGRVPDGLTDRAWEAIHTTLQEPASLATRGAIYTLGMHGQLEAERDAITRLKGPVVGDCWRSQGPAIFD